VEIFSVNLHETAAALLEHQRHLIWAGIADCVGERHPDIRLDRGIPWKDFGGEKEDKITCGQIRVASETLRLGYYFAQLKIRVALRTRI
jgi:hypothetical protein